MDAIVVGGVFGAGLVYLYYIFKSALGVLLNNIAELESRLEVVEEEVKKVAPDAKVNQMERTVADSVGAINNQAREVSALRRDLSLVMRRLPPPDAPKQKKEEKKKPAEGDKKALGGRTLFV